ncbi:4-hydroxyproline epimerase [Paraburkholderia sp. Tr-20389]|uniref:4-hydroxyproline epimerase n=1 Tax=Paraburkholderia sp. Tr-20389 TaxID=2703903 RepID=UPI00197ED9EC|nr:4-hydroxyproline epimerase [Paraburkholderia sp. Tr-20389]MBN3753715.1 4-hydroxyproline epimerase [Paraburkholderia sp. Tr-20389]
MSRYTFKCIEGHTEGMPVRMVIEGGPELHGATMNDRRLYFIEKHDWVRRSLSLEPRGHGHMSGTIFYPPLTADADFSLLFIESSGSLPMCGHATIGSVSFALETGLIVPKQPGQVIVDVPAGKVKANYTMADGRVTSVRFTNVASFLLHRDIEITHSHFGKLRVDIAYGGNFYPIVEVQDTYPGCEHFSPDQLLKWGRETQRLVNKALDVVHPDNPLIRGVKHCMWTGKPVAADSDGRSVVIAGDTIVDRSPCGTGTSARVAQRFARGLLGESQPFRHESLICSRFTGRVEGRTRLESGLEAVFPSIEGRAWITGRGEHYVEDGEPYAHGFSLQEFTK